ncbi:MAG TPA: phosphatase PAP2 family protein [Acidimicrobiales bacterium]|nr:phosphatase PAP2 family protein [Acidimicrobiales bacterium]
MPHPLHRATRAIARFDAAIDGRVDELRGHPHLDRLMYAASELGDFSLIWHLVSATRAVAPDRTVTHATRMAAVLGVESVLVNGPVKRLFRRHRPAWEQERPRRLRRPRTTSFPSGHASSAFTAAGVLSENDPLWPLYYGIAAVVASSRVYVKIHHPSDVVAGALLGVALARVARRAWPMPAPPGRHPGAG